MTNDTTAPTTVFIEMTPVAWEYEFKVINTKTGELVFEPLTGSNEEAAWKNLRVIMKQLNYDVVAEIRHP
jgi:hypothetical protein